MHGVLLYGELTQLSTLRYDYLATDSQYLFPFSMVFPVLTNQVYTVPCPRVNQAM